MKHFHRLSISTLCVLTAALVAGCAMGTDGRYQARHDQTAMKEMQEMCEMHKKMMDAKSPAERQAMMDHMKTMSPNMQQHMQMMQEQCK